MRKTVAMLFLLLVWVSTVLANEGREPTNDIKVLQVSRSGKAFMGDRSLVPSDDRHDVLIVKVNVYKNGELLHANRMDGETTRLLLLDSNGKSYSPNENYSVELANDANITLYFNVPKDSGELMLRYRDSKLVPVENQESRKDKMKRR